MSQGPMSNSPSKGGTMRSQMPTSYQSPFGNQNYRTQTSPSKGGQPSFGGSAYQQPGQFGGQIMNRPMPSPGGKGGYQQPMMQQPMPSPGGKGGSYQRQPTPFGYGQSTFNPGQFAGYGQPSNVFSFNNPHYQPYMPPTYDSGQTGQSPDIGNNPMTPQPEVMAQPVDQSAVMREQIRSLGQEGIQSGAVTRDMLIQAGYSNPDQILGGGSGNQGAVQTAPTPQPVVNAMPPEPRKPIVDPKTAFMPSGGYNPSMPFGGKGGGRSVGGQPLSRYMPPEGYSSTPTPNYDPNAFRVFDPYGEGGAYEGRPRPTFPDPSQPQGPQGTIQGAPSMSLGSLGGKGGGAKINQMPTQAPIQEPSISTNQNRIDSQLLDAQYKYDLDQLRNPDVPLSRAGQEQNYLSQFSDADRQRLGAQSIDGRGAGDFGPAANQIPVNMATGAMNSGLGSLFNSQQLAQRLQGAVGGPRLSPQQSPESIERDRAAYAMSQSGNRRINPRLQNMR